MEKYKKYKKPSFRTTRLLKSNMKLLNLEKGVLKTADITSKIASFQYSWIKQLMMMFDQWKQIPFNSFHFWNQL